MISTNPVQGRKYGYDPYEGLRPDGLYAFTGEGVRGDRKLLRGNLALISSAQAGRIVRRFTVRGVDATYIGAFTLADPPFDYRHVPDVDGPMRRGIILLLAEPSQVLCRFYAGIGSLLRVA